MKHSGSFMQGYICAVTELIRLEGCVTTAVRELWAVGGYSLKECNHPGNEIDIHDLTMLNKFKEEL